MKNAVVNRIYIWFLASVAGIIIWLMSFTAVAQDRENTAADGFALKEVYPWYAQPWVWALIASGVVLLVGYLSYGGKRGKAKMEDDSEEGTTHP